ncbi:AAWKG family protein [Streptomyces sp. NPDC048324]|uniref:AAWKG family protein n=1 Tax=Streptomyces sp. NPDC048324 TaxID=3157205 RepID=UPI003417F55E
MADETPGKWETTVYLMTGYKVPTRDSVTEDLKGKSRKYGDADDNAVDAPWIDVTISNVGKVDGTALANRLASRGDFLLFYAGTGDGGPMTNAKKLNLYVVRIGFPWQRGSGQAGTNFQKYSLGSNAAISQLSYPPYRTTGFSFDGLSVAEEDAVDLGTFSHRARSIDRAMAFFDQHEQRLKTWTDAMDGPGAAWQGNAAGVFQNLITTLHTQYKHYKEQLAPPGFSAPLESKVDHYRPRTYHGAGLVRAEMALSVGLRTLKVAFDDWHSDKGTVSGTAPDGSATTAAAHWDPEVTVRGVLHEVAQWINANNAGKVVTHSTTYGSTGSTSGGDDYWYDTMAGFKENVPAYGPLTDPNTWVKIAQEAVSRWKNNVVAHLDPAAETAQTGLAEAWSKLLNTAWDPDYGFEEAPAATLSSTGNSGGNSNSTFNPNDIASLFNNQNASVNDALNNITGSMNNALNDQNQALNDIGESTNNALNDLFSGGSGTTDSALNDTGLTGTPDVNGLLSDTAGTGDTGSGGTSDTAAGVSPAYTSLLNGALNSLGSSGGSGSTKVNPDGSITVTNADGSTTTTRPDGTEVTTFPDGSTSTTGPDGRTTLVDADGSTSVQNADGTVTTTFPDGSKVTLGPDGSYTTTGANGTVTHGDLQPGQSITNPDGSTTKVNADGSVTTTFPDGLVSTLKPDGTYTVDQPDGSGMHTSSLGGGAATTVPAPHGSTGTVNTSLNGSLNGGLSSGGSSGLPLTDSATDGDFLYDDVPYTSSLSGALGGAPGTDGFSAGTGLNPGALAAASRAGAMNGDLSGSERVRSGFADTDSAVTGSPRTTSAGSRAAAAAEEAAAARTATSSSGAPFFPGAGAGPGGQSTQSEDRTRTTWLSEDEEVWGTEDGGVPAVLGRDD